MCVCVYCVCMHVCMWVALFINYCMILCKIVDVVITPFALWKLYIIALFYIIILVVLKVICNENFTCVFYCINMFVLPCNAQKTTFNNYIANICRDIKPQTG